MIATTHIERGRTRRVAMRRGVTIVELMVVLAIVGTIMGLSVYMLSSATGGDLRSDAMRLSSTIKYTYSQAALNNTRYRLVMDLDTGEYWTEVTGEPIVAEETQADVEEEYLTEEARRLAAKHQEESDLFDDEEENPFGVNRKVTYERVHDVVIEDTKLDAGNRFDRVVTAHREEPFTEGNAAITFFPNGFQEQAMIVLRGADGGAYTLVTEPMTGRVRVHSKEIDIPSGFGEIEEDE